MYCYGRTPPVLSFYDHRFKSVTGAHQGDPLGPFLFSLVLHPVIQPISTAMAIPTEHVSEPTAVSMWYLDDGILFGKHSALQRAIHLLNSPDTLRQGLHLNISKWSVWWPSRQAMTITSAYPDELQQTFSEGSCLLNTQVGSFVFVE